MPAFKRALLAARSLGFAGDGLSGNPFLRLLDRLQPRQPLEARLVPFPGGYPGAAAISERAHHIVAPFFQSLPTPVRLVNIFHVRSAPTGR